MKIHQKNGNSFAVCWGSVLIRSRNFPCLNTKYKVNSSISMSLTWNGHILLRGSGGGRVVGALEWHMNESI